MIISAVPNIVSRYPISLTVKVWSGGTYIFTAMWDSDHVYLRITALSPAEMANWELRIFRAEWIELSELDEYSGETSTLPQDLAASLRFHVNAPGRRVSSADANDH